MVKATLTRHDLWRVELAREVSTHYSCRPGVKMMVLGGSPSRGTADRYSDLDIIVYWDAIDYEWIRQSPPLAGTRAERKGIREYQEDDTALESYYLETVKIDVGHTTLNSWEKMTGEVLEDFDPTPWKQKSIGGFLASVPLYGDSLVDEWKTRLTHYPEELALKTINASKGFLVEGCLLHQGLDRGELLFYYDGLCATLKKLLMITAATNRTFFSTDEPRWVEQELENMALKPDQMWPRILAMLTGDKEQALELLEELMENVFTLAEENVPGADFSKTRKGRRDLAVLGALEKPVFFSFHSF